MQLAAVHFLKEPKAWVFMLQNFGMLTQGDNIPLPYGGRRE